MVLPRKKPSVPAPAPVDVEAMRENLLNLRARLRGDHQGLQRGTLDNGNAARAPLHPADAATDSQDVEFAAQLLVGNSNMLEDVDDALDRLQSGKFGRCEECGGPIGAGRLRAKPWARLCINCKNREEAGEIIARNRS